MTLRAGRARHVVGTVFAASVLALAACSGGSGEAPASTSSTPPASAAPTTSTPPVQATPAAESSDVTNPTAPSPSATSDDQAALTTRSGDQICTEHGGLQRCWLIEVPPSTGTAAPLVIDFHGWTSNARSQRSSSGFADLAASEGFVVVWPEGYQSSFNAGPLCCAPASSEGINDVEFTRLLVSIVAEAHEIDRNRIYVTGLSNGCAMAQRIAADASDLVAAVACMSLYLLDDPDAGYTPVPVMELHGTNDGVVPYEPSALFDGAEENWSRWAERNGCTGDPIETWRSGASVTMAYQTCNGGVQVSLVTVDGGSHVLYPGAGTDIDTASLAWEFLQQFENGS